MNAPRYWVRFNDHVGQHDKDTLVMVLSRKTRRLTEKSPGYEYEVELMKLSQADRLEIALNSWESRGTIKWGRAE